MNAEANQLSGKTCLVTGGSSGIGKAAALALARKGARVLIVNRDSQRGSQALDDLRRSSGNPDIHLHLADLSSQAEIRQLVTTVKDQYPQIHVLINVAGAMFHQRKVSTDGIEMNLSLNYLSYFMLSTLLLDLLIKSAPARIINVTSVAHWWGKIHLDDLHNQRRYNIFSAYGNAKLAIILFTRELARRLAGTGVTANCVDPGIVATGIIQRVVNIRLAATFADAFFLTPEEGAETIAALASDPEAARLNGEYLYRKKPARCARKSRDMLLARRLWAASEAYIRPFPVNDTTIQQEEREYVQS